MELDASLTTAAVKLVFISALLPAILPCSAGFAAGFSSLFPSLAFSAAAFRILYILQAAGKVLLCNDDAILLSIVKPVGKIELSRKWTVVPKERQKLAGAVINLHIVLRRIRDPDVAIQSTATPLGRRRNQADLPHRIAHRRIWFGH